MVVAAEEGQRQMSLEGHERPARGPALAKRDVFRTLKAANANDPLPLPVALKPQSRRRLPLIRVAIIVVLGIVAVAYFVLPVRSDIPTIQALD
jgi:hypothetical protein